MAGRLRRSAWFGLGWLAVGVGSIGVVVPGLPTTVFFIMAAACFSRSSPRFEQWVLERPGVGPMVRDYRAGLGMPRRAKRAAIASIVVAIGVSALFGFETWWARTLLLALGAVGIGWILVRVPTRGPGGGRGGTRGSPWQGAGMTNDQKPSVTIPAGEAPTDLVLEDLVVGEGTEAVAGRNVMVHYVGVAWSNGQQFDASWDRGDTFDFRLGAGQVIQGWDQGVAGMKVGGRRRITIPPELGYGSRGAGGVIKGGETLVFVVDLLGVN